MAATDIADLIAQVTTAGGRLWLEDGQVRYAAPPGAIAPDLLAALRGAKAGIAGVLRGQGSPAPTVFAPVDRAVRLPLAGEELFFFDPLKTNRTGFPVMRFCMRLTGPWNAAGLKAVVLALVVENEILRTAYRQDADGGHREIIAAEAFSLGEFDIGAVEDAALPDLLAAQATADSRLYDVSRAPLFRASLFTGRESEIFVLLTAHHITYDGASWAVMVNRLFALYAAQAGSRVAAAPPPVQYADYAWAQRHWLESPAAAGLLRYWQEKCESLPEPLDLKLGTGDTFLPRHAAAIEIPAATVANLAVLAEKAGASLFIAVLALFNILLALRTGTRDIVIGSPFMVRDRLEEKSLLGCFVNQLVFRRLVDLDASFVDLLRDVRRETLAAYASQPLPSDLVARRAGLSFEEFHRRAYSVMLVDQSSLPGLDEASLALAAQGLHIEAYDHPAMAAGLEARMPPPGAGQPVLSLLLSQLDKDKPLKAVLTCFRARSPAVGAALEEMAATFHALTAAACVAPEEILSRIVPA